MNRNQRSYSSHQTGYGLARGHDSIWQRVGDALWSLSVTVGGLLVAVGITYYAMDLALRR